MSPDVSPPRRKGYLALTTILVTVAAAVMALPALAVSSTGLFELDGNAISTGGNPGTGADDWDRVCHDVTNDGTVFNANGTGRDSFQPPGHNVGTLCPPNGTSGTNTHGADALEWTHAASQNEVNFTGGGSKDPNNISSWAYTLGVGGNPGKDILLDGFAAKYHEASSPVCPTLGPDPQHPIIDGSTICRVLFFGMDRFDNSGDAQNGFWFLQDKVKLGTNTVGGGMGFVGVHKNGDVLVTTDFSVGGGTSTIDVFAWDPTCLKTTGSTAGFCGDANLRILFASSGAKCSISTPLTPACGIVNPNDGTSSPWPFTDKSGNSTYLNGEFFEGGLNISNLAGLNPNECFASTLAESRSSTSTTATLKVFVLGGFGSCGSKTVTTPSQIGAKQLPTTASVTPNASSLSETDMADITVTGTSTFGGTVQFSLCFNPAVNCVGDGTAIGSPVTVTGSSGTASVQSPTASVTSVGTYCWRADYSGDPSVGVPPSSDPAAGSISTSECFSVLPVQPTLLTKAGASSVILGNPVSDTAALTGTANQPGTPNVINPTTPGALAGGTITFQLFGPSTPGSGCGSAASGLITQGVNGDNTYGPVFFTPTAPGVYHWVASYAPDTSGNTLSASDNGGCTESAEDVTVFTIPTGTVTTPMVNGNTVITTTFNSTVFDNAVVTASSGGGPAVTGTVNFFVCTPTQVKLLGGTCASDGTAEGSFGLSPISNSNPPAGQATSNGVVVNATGVWCFRAEYVSNNPAYTNSSDSSATECFLVNDTVGATSDQSWTPNDTATVSSAHGAPLNGTVQLQLYVGSADCSIGAVNNSAVNVTVNANGQSSVTVSTSNTSYSVSTSTVTSWKVTFTSTDPNVPSNSFCTENSNLMVNGNS